MLRLVTSMAQSSLPLLSSFTSLPSLLDFSIIRRVRYQDMSSKAKRYTHDPLSMAQRGMVPKIMNLIRKKRRLTRVPTCSSMRGLGRLRMIV